MKPTTVTFQQFWSKSFLCVCFIPLTILAVLQIMAENWMAATWQVVTLAILCVNNYLLCSNYTLKKELFEQLQINIALIQHIKEDITKQKGEIKSDV
jgi:hypothetical protein